MWDIVLDIVRYFYPRTPCGVRRGVLFLCQRHGDISIHVPRAGYDGGLRLRGSSHLYFYPRTPCGVRRATKSGADYGVGFLSTYPVRGTTAPEAARSASWPIFLSTYPVRGTTKYIEWDLENNQFLSTYPVRGTTLFGRWQYLPSLYFYPRTPCGVRLFVMRRGKQGFIFLSTYPVRGTTSGQPLQRDNPLISIHVPRAGYDINIRQRVSGVGISIHVPRAGYDQYTPRHFRQ